MNKKEYWKNIPVSERIILDLCGGTGSWSKPYKDAGYKVINVTLPEHDVLDYDDYFDYIDNIYGILAAPTCTHFSFARTTAKTPRDLVGAMELVDRCLEIIRHAVANGHLVFWALENPLGHLRQMIGKPYLSFSPNEYGATYTKKTDLWGYFNLPKRNNHILTADEIKRNKINARKLPTLPCDYILPEDFTAIAAKRSMTSSHFANAFFKANK